MANDQITLQFPLKGVDEHWGYSDQPSLTTTSALNVRPYSTDEERARGGQRPGLKKAFSTQVSSTSPVQWLGWLDTGFGDTVNHYDSFNYTSGTQLSAASNWASAAADLDIYGNAVTTSSAGVLHSSGSYQDFGTDTWDDWILESFITWPYGADAQIDFWVGSDDSGTDGCYAKIEVDATELASPLLGAPADLYVNLTSGSNTDSETRSFGVGGQDISKEVRIVGTKDTVTLFLDGEQMAAVTRDDGTCSRAGFKLKYSNAMPGFIGYGSYVANRTRVHDWRLLASTRSTNLERELVAIGTNSLWKESTPTTLSAVEDTATSWAGNAIVQAAHCNGRLFIADEDYPKYYDPMYSAFTGRVYDWSARKGKLEKTCKGITNWRNRVLLYRSNDDPQNIFASRQDEPFDFAYGRADPGSPWALNQGSNGRIGQPVECLMPVSQASLIVGCTNSIWELRGDPMAGGYSQLLTRDTGVLGFNAWCSDGRGSVYFMGQEGLWRMVLGGVPEPVSKTRIPDMGSWANVTGSGSAGEYYVSLGYDQERQGVLIVATKYSTGTSKAWFYDLRTDSFWPESYPASCRPSCVGYYPSETAANRRFLLGCTDGYLREFGDAQAYDVTSVSVAITSRVVMGPISLAQGVGRDAVVTHPRSVMGNDSDSVTWEIHSADTPEGVDESSMAKASGTWTSGANRPTSDRVRGVSHGVKVFNSALADSWSLERVTIEARPGGRRQ